MAIVAVRAGVCLAAPPATVVVSLATPDEGLGARLRAEFSAAGFVVVSAPPPAPGGSLLDAARREGALAAVSVRATAAGAELVVIDRATGKTVVRDLVVAREGGTPAELVATRAVELLRASLLELSEAHPPRGEVSVVTTPLVAAPAPAPSLPTADRSERWSAFVGPGVSLSPGGVGGAAELWVGSEYRLERPFHIAGLVRLPVAGTTLQTGDVQTHVSYGAFGVAAGTEVLLPRPWIVLADAGIAATWFHTSTVATPALPSASSTAWAALPYLHASLGAEVSPQIVLRTDVLTGVTLPAPGVRVDGVEVANWGRPVTAAMIGFDLLLP